MAYHLSPPGLRDRVSSLSGIDTFSLPACDNDLDCAQSVSVYVSLCECVGLIFVCTLTRTSYTQTRTFCTAHHTTHPHSLQRDDDTKTTCARRLKFWNASDSKGKCVETWFGLCDKV